MKKIKVSIDSTRDYIQLLNGLFNLTNSEMDVLAEFVKLKVSLDKSDIDINAFSTQAKKKVAERLNKEDFNTLNTYIKRLKDKGAIHPTQEGYRIVRYLIPTNKIVMHINEQ